MRRLTHVLQVLCVCALLVLLSISLAMAQDRVRAKIGIQIKDGTRTTWAKANDRLRGGAQLRVYVFPEEDAYVYVIYSDGKEATLLNQSNDQRIIKKGSVLTLPSEKEFYQIDGSSNVESFYIICSFHEIKEGLNGLSIKKMPSEQWNDIKNEINKKINTEINEEIKKPIMMAGNVRGMEDQLRMFAGNPFVIVQYEFSVKK